MWQEILQVQPIGIHDNFFELGGRSIQAIRIFSELEKRLGRVHPAGLLLQNPTIARLSAALEGEGDEASIHSLVPINTSGDGPNLFLVHAGGGHVFLYHEFANLLSSGARVYGLQPAGLDGTDEPLESVEEMAALYLDEIRAVQKSGPYHLFGYCYGATVIFEMAQRLRAEGSEVGIVAMVDSAAPNGFAHRDRHLFEAGEAAIRPCPERRGACPTW